MRQKNESVDQGNFQYLFGVRRIGNAIRADILVCPGFSSRARFHGPSQVDCFRGRTGRNACPTAVSLPRRSELDDAATDADGDRLSSISGAQFFHDVLDVHFDSLF